MPIVRIGEAYRTGGSHRVQIDAARDGSIVVLSTEAGSFLARIAVDGAETVLNQSPSAGNFSSGFVETLSDGRYVLYATANFGQNSGTFVQIVNRDGSLATGVVNPMFEGMDRQGSGYTLTPTNNGGFGFVWNDLSRSGDSFQLTYPQDPNNGATSGTTFAGYDVRVRYFDEEAVPTASSVVADEDIESVNGATVNRRALDQYINDSETLAGGQTAFVYVDHRWVANAGGGVHTEYQLSLQISTPGSVGEPVKIDLGPFGNSSADGNYPDSLFPEASANIVPLPDGSFAVIWSERTYVPAAVFGGYSSTGTQTVMRYFNAAGEALSDQITLVTRGKDYGNNNLFVWAEALPDGRIAIAYNDGVSGVNGNGTLDAFVGVVGPLGSSIEVSRVNAQPAANTQFYTIQDLAVRADGTIELAYSDVIRQDNVQRNETVIQRFAAAQPGEVVEGGTTGNDTTTGSENPDLLFGAAGNDRLVGLGGEDMLQGGSGDDSLSGGDGGDRLFGGDGSDELKGDGGNDQIDGGLGNDRVGGNAGDDNIGGGAGADALFGDAGNDRIGGGEDKDYLSGASGNDALFGDAGNDVLRGGLDNDYLAGGLGNDALYGDEGDDFVSAGGGDDYLDGGAGNDQLHGDAGNDRMLGKDGDDYLDGGIGSDQLNGDAGNDRLFGKDGEDRLDGGAGDDSLYGGNDRDTILAGADNDYVDGGEGDDNVQGQGGADTILGRGGNDTLMGGAGNDLLNGGGGDDTIDGGDADDILQGAAGADTLIGQGGRDQFRYTATSDSVEGASDTILGFAGGADRIDLSRIDANELVEGNQGFAFIGDDAFAGNGASAGQLRATLVQGSDNIWQVEGDTDGDGDADFVVLVDMSTPDPLTSADFIL